MKPLLDEALADVFGKMLADAKVAWAKDRDLGLAEIRQAIAEAKVSFSDIAKLVADRVAQLRDGADGSPGADGAPGAAGERGLQGDKGDAGERGERGDQGAAGENGRDGIDGARGEAGPRGKRGEAGELQLADPRRAVVQIGGGVVDWLTAASSVHVLGKG